MSLPVPATVFLFQRDEKEGLQENTDVLWRTSGKALEMLVSCHKLRYIGCHMLVWPAAFILQSAPIMNNVAT